VHSRISALSINDEQRSSPEHHGTTRSWEFKRETQAHEESEPGKKSAKLKAERVNEGRGSRFVEVFKGAMLAEIMKATNWQDHTVLGFLSILVAKGGEKIEASTRESGRSRNLGLALSVHDNGSGTWYWRSLRISLSDPPFALPP
jgi:hypothetical protein